jgi:hypothetical protein
LQLRFAVNGKPHTPEDGMKRQMEALSAALEYLVIAVVLAAFALPAPLVVQAILLVGVVGMGVLAMGEAREVLDAPAREAADQRAHAAEQRQQQALVVQELQDNAAFAVTLVAPVDHLQPALLCSPDVHMDMVGAALDRAFQVFEASRHDTEQQVRSFALMARNTDPGECLYLRFEGGKARDLTTNYGFDPNERLPLGMPTITRDEV